MVLNEQPHDVVDYGYGWADYFGEPVEPTEWAGRSVKPDIVIQIADFVSAPMIRAFFRLRNGQVIRVRPRRSALPATARCE